MRVVIAGLGDSGVLTAIKLAKHVDVVGISAKPGLVSGQELGWRLSRPGDWARHNWISFDKFRGLDRVRTVQGTLTGVDLAARKVFLDRPDGTAVVEPYDALVISTGVTNGFWRRPDLESADEIEAGLLRVHDRLAGADSVIVVGGGAAAVSSAANLARIWPGKRVELYFPGERALQQHHARVWERVQRQLIEFGVELHPGHRAVIPDGFALRRHHQCAGRIQHRAAACVRGRRAVGDRSSAAQHGMAARRTSRRGRIRAGHTRAAGARITAASSRSATSRLPIRFARRHATAPTDCSRKTFSPSSTDRPLRSFRPASRRWGSVLGIQPDGLEVFAPNGKPFRFPAWSFERC